MTERVRDATKNKPAASMKRGGGKTRKRRRQSHGLPTAISRQGISPLSRGEKEVQGTPEAQSWGQKNYLKINLTITCKVIYRKIRTAPGVKQYLAALLLSYFSFLNK